MAKNSGFSREIRGNAKKDKKVFEKALTISLGFGNIDKLSGEKHSNELKSRS